MELSSRALTLLKRLSEMKVGSRHTWIVLLSIWHLTAITVESIPPPSEDREAISTEGIPQIWPAATLGPMLDTADSVWEAGVRRLWNVTGPIRRLTRAYTRTIGLEQRWNMFSEPPESDQYVHMRYYVRTATEDSLRVDRELIFPARREDRFRPFNASYYKEKAVRNARQRFFRALGSTNPSRLADLPRDLAPIVRYYTDRRRRTVPPGDTIVRAELWVGSAPVEPPGGGQAPLQMERLDVLRDYYDGSSSFWVPAGTRPRVGSSSREADITWTFLFVEQWQ